MCIWNWWRCDIAIANGYSTLDEFKAYIAARGQRLKIDASDDTVIEDFIEAASRQIDTFTGRTFYARTETRLYSVPSGRELKLDDDLLTITTLTNGDDATIAATEYNLIPVNISPKRSIKLKASADTFWTLDSDGNTEFVISVTGTWGYVATTPDDIKQACLMMTNKLYRRYGPGETGVATITAAGLVITPQNMPPMAASTLRKYQKWL